jgi:nicotinamidase-related amidase
VGALVVVDMQEGILLGDPKYQLASVVERINRLAKRVRARGGRVFFIQHDGTAGDDFAPSTPGWQILHSIDRAAGDRIVRKTLNDGFFGTTLQSELDDFGADRVFVAGWATDMCVDATVRSAVAMGFPVVIVSDAHTVCDRPHLSATRIIEHHQWIWSNLFAPQPVTIAREAEILEIASS